MQWRQCRPRSPGAANPRRERVGDISPQHIQGSVRDIDDTGNAEDQRQTDRDKKQTGRGRKPVKRLKQECAECHDHLFPAGGERSTSERQRGSRVRGHSDKVSRSRPPHPARRYCGSPPSPRMRGEGRTARFTLSSIRFRRTQLLDLGIARQNVAPSTYLKSAIVPLPFSSAILPT